jgi:CBS domain-containing protein
MTSGEESQVVRVTTPIREATQEISTKKLGITYVSKPGALVGITKDADLRPHMFSAPDLLTRTAGDAITRNPRTLKPDKLAEAAQRLNISSEKITSLVVVGRRFARSRVRLSAAPRARRSGHHEFYRPRSSTPTSTTAAWRWWADE